MGKQINFYMTDDDEREFVKFVQSTGKVAVLSYTSPTEEPTVIEELPSNKESFWGCQFLWNTETSAMPSMKHIKQQGYFIPDAIESELVEFSRSFVDEGRLVRGRIWAEMNGWKRSDVATIIQKGDKFARWFDKLASWIKRRSTRNSNGDYLLPGATTFANQGGQLCQAVLSSGKAV